MLIRRLPLGALPAGTRFRFQEEDRSQGFPYTILPVSATYRGDQHFAEGEVPVVIHRKDGRYPGYGRIAGYFPVQNDEGRVVRWVAHPNTVVLSPNPLAKWLFYGLITLLLLIIAVTGIYWMLYKFGGS